MIEQRAGGRNDLFLTPETAFAELRAAFTLYPAPGNPAERSAAMTSEEREAWQSLQAQTVAGSLAEADIACLLALSGVDYEKNIRRLMGSLTAGEHPVCGHRSRDTGAYLDHDCRHKAGHIARLYERWHDPKLLDWLLDPTPRQAMEQIARSQALLSLWDAHWMQFLRAASRTPARCHRISEMLQDALIGRNESLLWQAYLSQLQRAVTERNPVIRRASLTVLAHLRRCRTSLPATNTDVQTRLSQALDPLSSFAGISASERCHRAHRRRRRITPNP